MNLAEMTLVLKEVEYKNWHIIVSEGPYLQVRFWASDQWWAGRKWRLSPWMTKSELVQTALMAILAAEEHEAREHFLYRGKAVFGPHLDVEALWSVANVLDKREDPQ